MAERKQARLIILDSIHPVFGQECIALNAVELSKKIVSNMDSDGDYYDTLRQNDLL